MENIKPREGLPANAQLVFKGVIFEVWQWEQEMFDGTKQTFEKVWRFPTVEIVATVGDKILIEQQDQPDRKNNITLISGRADQDEEPIKEAKRELLEETGYQSDDWSLFLKHGKDGKVLHEVYYFIARNCKKIKEPELDAGEKITTQLITFDKFIDLVDEPRFWVSQEFKNYLLRLQLDRKKKEDFKKILFP
jgi:ADP-ribose pyrophosphatase